MSSRFTVLALALVLAPAVVQRAAAQNADQDTRWQAFLGCWEPLTQDGAESAPEHVVCFRPHESGAVAAATVVDGEVRSEELIHADGNPRPMQDESCSGTETARWSADGARVFLRSELDCGNEVMGRESAGVLALSSAGTFIDVQAVGVDDQFGVRVLEYRALSPAEYPTSLRDLAPGRDNATRLYAAAPLALQDITEASAVLPPAVVQAMLVSLPTTRIEVDADALLALDAAGVDGEVIDVIVALAHPEKFAVATAATADEEMARTGRTEWMSNPYYDPWRYDRYNRYSRYGYNGYYYSPFGYNPYGWGNGGGTVIIIDRDDTGDGEATGDPKFVKGRGFTRGGGSSTGTTTSEPRSTRSQPSAGRSSGTTRATPAPSRGSSERTTRKAKPKSPPDRS